MRRRRFSPATIGGDLDWRALAPAVEPERLHDRHAFREQAHDLADLGMDPAAIARSLGLRRRVVRDLLGLPED